jgi:hypothetical protein
MDAEVQHIADLLNQRNAIDAEIAAITHRPMAAGHLGEWLAARIFGITLARSAIAVGIDGHFAHGPLAGATVNVKWYLKREGLLDVSAVSPDYYLVLAGPIAAATSSKGAVRPWCIDAVHLFEASRVLRELEERGVKLGTATSVRASQWDAAEIYPIRRNTSLRLTVEQQLALSLFHS